MILRIINVPPIIYSICRHVPNFVDLTLMSTVYYTKKEKTVVKTTERRKMKDYLQILKKSTLFSSLQDQEIEQFLKAFPVMQKNYQKHETVLWLSLIHIYCQELVNCLPDELARLKEQANQIPMRSILRGITVLQECLDQIGRSYDKRLCVEMAFLKLCMPELDDSSEALAQRLDRLEAVIKSGGFAPVSAPQAPQAMAMPEPAAVREGTPAESVKKMCIRDR